MTTRTISRTARVSTTVVSSGVARSVTRAFAVAVLAGTVALAFVVWPLAAMVAAVSAFAVYAVSSAVSGAREMYGPGGTDGRRGATAGDRRLAASESLARNGRVRRPPRGR